MANYSRWNDVKQRRVSRPRKSGPASSRISRSASSSTTCARSAAATAALFERARTHWESEGYDVGEVKVPESARPRMFAGRDGYRLVLEAAETPSYIAHHLALAGRSDTLFSDDAVALIHQVSRGLPRVVNNLAVQSLVAAFAADKAVVDESSARAAVTEVSAE